MSPQTTSPTANVELVRTGWLIDRARGHQDDRRRNWFGRGARRTAQMSPSPTSKAPPTTPAAARTPAWPS